jgi:hypothetical protein
MVMCSLATVNPFQQWRKCSPIYSARCNRGAYVHMVEHSPSAKEAIAKAEAALGWAPGSSYCKAEEYDDNDQSE